MLNKLYIGMIIFVSALVLIGCINSINTVKYDRGGDTSIYRARGIEYHNNPDLTLTINGECYSACTVMADIARPSACITENALFFFHKGAYEGNLDIRLKVKYSSDIDTWIERHGGQPEKGFLKMSFEEAKAFWKICEN